MSDDPAEMYTFEDFMAEQNVLDSLGRRIEAKLNAKVEVRTASRRRSDPRKYINKNREAAHAQLVADYFAEAPLYSDTMFRRRFRMRRPPFSTHCACPRCVVSLFHSKNRLYQTSRFITTAKVYGCYLYACIWHSS